MDEVLLYMAREDAKIVGLHAKARLFKNDRLCEMLYLYPENTLVLPSKCMLLLYGFRGWTPPPPRRRFTIWACVVPAVSCPPSERPRDATGLPIACQFAKGITIAVGKVELGCYKPYAELGVCPTSAAMDT